jgi:general secretion pathway protein L
VQLDLEAWSRELGVPCEAGARWDGAGAQEAPPIELLQGEFEPPSRTRALLPRLRPALILLGAALALHALATTVHWAALRLEKSRLQAEMRERFRAAFPQAQAIVDPPLQMRRQLDALHRAAGTARPDDFLVLLGRAAPSVNARVSAISYEKSRLVLDLEMDARPEAEALLRRLQANGSAVALAALNPKGKRIEARFVFSPRGGA